MFRIKICGITNVTDALMTAEAGADAIGLNFFDRSPRYIASQTAGEIVKRLPPGVVKVGLFVDTPADAICRLFDELPLDLIQLHGDQPPEFLAALGNRPAMQAFRVGPDGLQPVLDYLAKCRLAGSLPKMVLIDAHVPGQYGGTGKVADWDAAKQYAAMPGVPPLVLAGGLTPENVALAIQTVAPAAVDVAGGVETAPGRKDPAAVRAFVHNAQSAISRI